MIVESFMFFSCRSDVFCCFCCLTVIKFASLCFLRIFSANNIMVTSRGMGYSAKLIDFGLALKLESPDYLVRNRNRYPVGGAHALILA